MNVYQKLQAARVELQKRDMKKSGKNDFSKYKYFELCDFLPLINEIFYGLKLCSVISFTSEIAMLQIFDAEKDDSTPITFTSPMVETQLKGCLPIQSIGAVETYQRRYLYMLALEIVEHDALDENTGNTTNSKEEVAATKQPKADSKVITQGQVKLLYARAGQKGVLPEKLKAGIEKEFGCKIDELNRDQFNQLLERLDAKPDVEIK